MTPTQHPHFTVVVADRAHAYVYETERLGGALDRVATLGNPSALVREHDLGTYAPGRSFNRASGAHQTYDRRHSLRSQAAAQFARVVGKTIELSAKQQSCGGIVLVAAPKLLSEIRRALPKLAQRRVLKEIPKDLVHQPKRVIAELLQRH